MSNLPFVEEILADLRRFRECAEDDNDVYMERSRFDLLVQLGLLERVQRSPAQWMMTRAGEDAIAQPAAGEPVHQWADQDLWMDGDEADLASARAEGFKTRTLWTAPPAAAHGDEAPGTVRVTADWLKTVHRDLDACQKVIWLAGCRPRVPGGFDPAYCEDAQERLKEIDEQIARANGAEGSQHA